MRAAKKRLVAMVFMIITTSALAIFLSTVLGKAYLNILKAGNVPRKAKPPAALPVSTEQPEKSKEFMPVTLFFLQGGVYSEIDSARLAAESFIEAGVEPFITPVAPHRLYIGFFGSRDQALAIKEYFSEKGISLFTQSVVLNGTNLNYAQKKDGLIRDWSPFLEACSRFFKAAGEQGNLGVFPLASSTEDQNYIKFLGKEADKLLIAFGNLNLGVEGSPAVAAQAGEALKSVRQRAEVLQSDWNQHNYDMMVKAMIELVISYMDCWNYLAEPDKT